MRNVLFFKPLTVQIAGKPQQHCCDQQNRSSIHPHGNKIVLAASGVLHQRWVSRPAQWRCATPFARTRGCSRGSAADCFFRKARDWLNSRRETHAERMRSLWSSTRDSAFSGTLRKSLSGRPMQGKSVQAVCKSSLTSATRKRSVRRLAPPSPPRSGSTKVTASTTCWVVYSSLPMRKRRWRNFRSDMRREDHRIVCAPSPRAKNASGRVLVVTCIPPHVPGHAAAEGPIAQAALHKAPRSGQCRSRRALEREEKAPATGSILAPALAAQA